MRTTGRSPLVQALALLAMTLSACTGNAQEQPTGTPGDTPGMATDTPRTEVRVNKEYDEHGNLIDFDSTYASFHSTYSTDPTRMDSLFRDLRSRMNRHFPMMNDPVFHDLFFRDSILQPDFFHDDFFRRRMDMNERWMQELMAEMDSMKNAYFRNGTRLPLRPDQQQP